MRYLVYFLYHPTGRVDDYVVSALKALRPRFDFIHVVFNGELQPAERTKLAFVERITERPNDEFDVGAYKAAIFSHPDAFYGSECTELTLANFTFFAPIGSFDALFAWEADQSVDFWGVSAHKEMVPNPFNGTDILPYHIQSHWITVRARLLRDPAFLAYWRNLPPIKSYEDSVVFHESQFTRHFAELGFKYALFLDDSKFDSTYPAFNMVDAAVADGLPLVKRRLFYHLPYHLDQYDVNVRATLEHIEEHKLYDLDLVWDSVVGTVPPGVLYQNVDLVRVVPDASIAVALSAEEQSPSQVVLIVAGELSEPAMMQACTRFTFPCHVHALVESKSVAARLQSALAARAEVRSLAVEAFSDARECFAKVRRFAESLLRDGDRPILFARIAGDDVVPFVYGMRHACRDATVAAMARRAIGESRYHGLLLPLIKTYTARSETEALQDAARRDIKRDLTDFGLRPSLSDLLLYSEAGVFWCRAGLLQRLGEVVEATDLAGREQPTTAAAASLPDASGTSRGRSAEQRIASLLSTGLPFLAAERRYLTMAISNTREIGRNFVKMEAKFRHVSSEDDREAFFREVQSSAFQQGWQKEVETLWAKAFEQGRLAVEDKVRGGQGKYTRLMFDDGFKTGWRQALKQHGLTAPKGARGLKDTTLATVARSAQKIARWAVKRLEATK